MHGLQEFVERDATVFEHGADLHGELLAALTALMKADAYALGRVRLDLADAFDAAAMRADRTVRPKNAL